MVTRASPGPHDGSGIAPNVKGFSGPLNTTKRDVPIGGFSGFNIVGWKS
jgi:hypothetical protein